MRAATLSEGIEPPRAARHDEMSVDALLRHLHGVRETGPARWLARCPAHDDHSPSLSIRELDDGRVLVHDFAGCAVADVLSSVGLTFDALYPARAIDHHRPRERRPFFPEDVIRATAHEALVAGVMAARISFGMSDSWDDTDRLQLAAARLIAASDVLDDGSKRRRQNEARAHALAE
jgi:hypothetical protein